MAEHSEALELSEIKPKEKETQTSTVKTSEVAADEEVALLKSKLGDVREKVGKHRDSVLSLGSIFTEDVVLSHKVKELSEAEVLSEADRLSESEKLDVQELKYSSQVASRVSGLRQRVKQQGKETITKKAELISERNRLQSDLEVRERVKGLRRFANAPSRASVSRKIQELDSSIARFEVQEREALKQATKYQKSHSRLRETQEKVLLDVIRPELDRIRKGYEDFLDSILEDGRMLREIRELYIEKNVIPTLETLEQEGEIKAEETEKFLSQLKTSLVERDKSKDGDDSIPQELKEAASGFLKEVRTDVQNLLAGHDRFIVKRFVSQLAYDELSHLEKGVVDSRSSFDWRGKVDDCFKSVFRPPRDASDKEIAQSLDQIQPVTITTFSLTKMPLFDVARESRMARAVFGEAIGRIDNEIYETVIDKALDDKEGDYICLLPFYPTPETVRNLAILAAANYENYRTFQANSAFCRLARRKDWGALLDRAETEFPTLVKARKILESWKLEEYQSHPEIKNATTDLALSIISSGESVGQRLVNLAVEALPNDDIWSMLVKEDVLTTENVLAARKGVEFLRDFVETPEKRVTRLSKDGSELTEDVWQLYDFEDRLWHFESRVRETTVLIKKIAGDENRGELLPELLGRFSKLGRIANELQKHADNSEMIDYLTSSTFLDLATNASEEGIVLLFRAADYCPILVSKEGRMFLETLKEKPEAFLNEDGLRFFQRFSDAYSDYSESEMRKILAMVSSNQLDGERAELLPSQAGDLLEKEHFTLVTDFPELFLSSDEGVGFYREMSRTYQEQKQLTELSSAIARHNMPKELALSFSEAAPLLMESDRQATRSYILQNAQLIVRNEEDLKFLNSFVGMHGKAADQLVRDYTLCVEAGSVDSENRSLVLDFTKEFRVLSPGLFDGYKDASRSGAKEIYLSGLKTMAERMASSSPLTEQERKLPYYKDLVRAVYPNNSGRWTSYENNETCADRSGDLDDFEIRPRYDIDLMSVAEVQLKEGEVLAQSSVDKLKDQILALYQEMSKYEYDLERTQEDLTGEINEALVVVREAGGLSNIDFDKIQTTEEKIFLLLADCTYGTRATNTDTLKQLLVKYEFAYFDDIRQYVQGTSDRVSRANNQDYALLCELHSFFSDRIKEVNRSLVRAGWDNPAIADVMPQYFTQLAEDLSLAKQQDQINRLRIDRLGLSDGFVQQVSRTLSGKTGRKYTPKQVRRLLRLFESVAGGLQEKTTSPKKRTKALYGQLKAQRDKTFQAMQAITGEVIDPVDIHLGNVDLHDLLSQQREIETAKYDSEQFANYTAQRFLELFSEERNTLGTELGKFESSTGKKREVVHGYITKTKESAHARMVGGVCVAGDNPSRHGKECQWNMPNYFQLVLQDPETFRCQGLVMLHHFINKEGKKDIICFS